MTTRNVAEPSGARGFSLRSFRLWFDAETTVVSGVLMFRDGVRSTRIDVRSIDESPGWTLSHAGATADEPSDPSVFEADRLMRVLTISSSEVARREQAVRGVIASGRLSGFADDLDWQTQLFRFARGEITDDELRTYANQPISEVEDPDVVVPESAMPQAWWDAVHARAKKRLIALSLTTEEAAAALECDADELDTLLAEHRLVSYAIDGVKRIPSWQITDPDPDGSRDILPGVDVVIAAAPVALQAPERLTRFMTTPHQNLYLDGREAAPARWMAEEWPLRTVVALLNGHAW